MLRILVVALVVLVAAMFMLPHGARGKLQATTLLPEPRALPDVALTDARGQPLHLGDLRGDFTLVFFGFTNCPDVCPLTLKALADARAELARRAPRLTPPKVLFISVDPARDSADRMAAYLGNFDPAFIGATAADAALEPLLAALGVTVEKHAHDGARYNIVHGTAVYFLDADARWIAVAKGPQDPAVFAADYLKIRLLRPTA
ncbi:MAG TPA: SCO family protein [Gammaproteobacteria bacterium]|nr:SCO family protein [Gammaproteobacteria bacterium]